MSFSEPPKSLDNSCTVVHDNTLYSFNPDGFLSLRLEEGAEWKELKMGVKVTGSTCVGSTPPDAAQAGFFVIGGQAEGGDYNGLQKYTYSTGEWTTITAAGEVTNNRRWHASAYIQADDTILVYAGTTDGAAAPSSQTFTIKASEPYSIKGYSSVAPAGISPTILRWSVADAVLLGGDDANTKVYLFNPTAGWRDFGATLAEPLKDTSLMRVALVTGADGSQNLLTFDMTKSPNEVKRFVLQDAAGSPIMNSASVGRRDLTLGDWPEYNATLAPTETRSNYAMAQGPDGKLVFSGGNTEHPIRIFDVVQNNWVDESRLLSEQKPLNPTTASASVDEATSTLASTSSEATSSVTKTSATSEITSSITSSSLTSSTATTDAISSGFTSSIVAPSETAAVPIAGGANEDINQLSSGAVLGITLGSIIGFLALLGLLLILLRRRKRRNDTHAEAGQARGLGDSHAGEKGDMGAFAKEISPPETGAFRGHRPTMSQESFSSVAILMGRLGQPKTGLARKPSNDTSRSSVSSLHKQFKNKISKPIPQTSEASNFQGYGDKEVAFAANTAEPRPRNGLFPAEDGIRRSSGWNKYWSGGSALQLLGFGAPPAPQRNTVASQRSSRYSEAPMPVQNSRRTQDSATVPPLNFEGTAGLNRVNSGSPIVSQYSGDVHLKTEMAGKIERPQSRASSGYSSGIPESVADAWDPMDNDKPWGTARAPSSAYAPSVYYNTPLAPGNNTGSAPTIPPSGVSTQPQLAMASKSSDMSWLNLGDPRRI
ncbi:hypothetical protein HJFPF1_00924 [Paramyrothecium foliicola]|nr:hypothetical protein HJFPF1_00924 [Paramyrothecium foliicola]